MLNSILVQFPLLYYDKLPEDGMPCAKMKTMQTIKNSQAKEIHGKEKKNTARQVRPSML